MGPFSTSRNGNRYVAIAVDAFSKYVEAKGNYIFIIKPTIIYKKLYL